MVGKIIKGIAGFYYVHVNGLGVFECKARGVFRNQNIKPLIGDDVEIEILNNETKTGNILDVLPRINELIRPTVANIGQVMIVFAVNQPEPNLNLLDRFLIMVERKEIQASICFNKVEIETQDKVDALRKIYESIGYRVFLTSAKLDQGIDELMEALEGTTTVFAGPSGVGKSSILNHIQTEIRLETGGLSEKVQRGKHTTRHAELICFKENSYVVDTPGFSSLSIDDIDYKELKDYFIEFAKYDSDCKFLTCNHIHEPVCGVKKALEEGLIHPSRYENYLTLFDELKQVRRW